MIVSYILCGIVVICFGAIVTLYFVNRKDSRLHEPVNQLNKLGTKIKSNKEIFDLFFKEWEVVINTQMHFNDLILRFRSFVLTAFFALVSAIVAIQKIRTNPLSEEEYLLLLFIPLAFWITAFLIDYFYYHKMLLGAVAQAMKFDENELFSKNGLFGLTTCINKHVRPSISRYLVIIYYFLPVIVLVILYLVRRYILIPGGLKI